MRKFGKTFRPFLINTEQDFCAFVSDNGADSSFTLMKKMLNVKSRYRFGNWYHPCPILVTGRSEMTKRVCDNIFAPRDEDTKETYRWTTVKCLI